MTQTQGNAELSEEKPPIFGTWRRMYLAVVLHLAFLIILFYFFSKAFL